MGILFYLANTIATSMYLVGGVEILLVRQKFSFFSNLFPLQLYLTPWLTIGGEEVHSETGSLVIKSYFYKDKSEYI